MSGKCLTWAGLQLQEVDLPDEFDVEIGQTQAQLQAGENTANANACEASVELRQPWRVETLQELEVAFAERVEREVAMQTASWT